MAITIHAALTIAKQEAFIQVENHIEGNTSLDLNTLCPKLLKHGEASK
jgi:hypothetical protein